MVASHDPRFLNTVGRRMIHLEDGLGREYRGNYDAYREAETKKTTAQANQPPLLWACLRR